MSAAHLRWPSTPRALLPAHVRGCTGKIAWESRCDAQRHRPPRALPPYQCRHCGGWHNTSHKKD